jgi:hypothetical protein
MYRLKIKVDLGPLILFLFFNVVFFQKSVQESPNELGRVIIFLLVTLHASG